MTEMEWVYVPREEWKAMSQEEKLGFCARVVNVRRAEMFDRFPPGSYARLQSGKRAGSVVQITGTVSNGVAACLRFTVLLDPFSRRKRRRTTDVEMQNLGALGPLEILAMAAL